ncbi:MAG: VOC family protein [Chloroflexota bacterium]|nr:MAG: glyoxalase [Chloroflexota bacterium]
MALRIASVTIDCHDTQLLANFWTAALGYDQSEATTEAATAEDPRDRDVELVFVRVPEAKTVKNRVHIDIGADDMEAEVERVRGLGAERVETFKNWTVMRDPEGNEFCIVQVPESDPIESWRT